MSIYTIWNYFIKGFSKTISGNKGELSKFTNQKCYGINFYVIKWKFKILITFKTFAPITMPNALSKQWRKDPLWIFISRKSNQFDLKPGDLINLTISDINFLGLQIPGGDVWRFASYLYANFCYRAAWCSNVVSSFTSQSRVHKNIQNYESTPGVLVCDVLVYLMW